MITDQLAIATSAQLAARVAQLERQNGKALVRVAVGSDFGSSIVRAADKTELDTKVQARPRFGVTLDNGHMFWWDVVDASWKNLTHTNAVV